ncbi:hypothetical protein V1517DRAFT_350296 [Lipomyces orientalis]|uniref:Uncharacterized protein n=1 Tax=Lipomyces orientalis TaxID=1233043 RepID=A0ACC3TX26_9ASCO
MDSHERQTIAGQAIYTKLVSNWWIWKCPTPIILTYYDRHMSDNHLDVGVGTGYYLVRAKYPSANPRIVLFDLNSNALEHTMNRIARFAPESHQVDVLEPISLKGHAKFDSVGINYLLHCLPGVGISGKSCVFDHLRETMNDDAVLFGATILGRELPRSWVAKKLIAIYNSKGVFSNRDDGLVDLKGELEKRFRDVDIEDFGCVATFSACDLLAKS